MRRLTSCVFFLISVVAFSQNNTSLSDKEYIELQDKVRAYANSNLDSVFIFADRIEKSNNYIHKVFGLGTKSYLFQRKKDSVKSRQYYKIASGLLEKIPPSNEKTKVNAYLLNYGGLSEWQRQNFGEALDRFQEGKRLSQKTGDVMQVVKFNNNISMINAEAGNFKLAIKASKEMDAYTDKIEYLYTKGQFIRNKSNINFNLGTYYEKYYFADKSKRQFLDSAEYYYKKALNYSKDIAINKINAKSNLGNVYYQKNDLLKAQKMYEEVLFIAKDDKNLIDEYYNVMYNLGDLCFTLNKYDEALMYFEKIDSIYKVNKTGKLQYINSNYYQAKIYNIKKNAEKASEHSRIYIENYEENELKLNDEISEINLKLNNTEVKKEMLAIQEKYKNAVYYKYLLFFLLVLLSGLVFFVKSKRDKKKINEKVNAIVEAYKLQQENATNNLSGTNEMGSMRNDFANDQIKKESPSVTLDEEKEKEILARLAVLEKKMYYLKPDFTQQSVAKKIKTNTTYLSYVVNKKFHKSFSEYSNELKINFAINEMISNPVYRKYSTQAIAESVGFKNAVSFTKSFNKRTGVTPAQFIKRLENNPD